MELHKGRCQRQLAIIPSFIFPGSASCSGPSSNFYCCYHAACQKQSSPLDPVLNMDFPCFLLEQFWQPEGFFFFFKFTTCKVGQKKIITHNYSNNLSISFDVYLSVATILLLWSKGLLQYGGTPWVFCLLAPCLSPRAVAILSPALWNMLTPALNLDRAQTEVCLGPFDRTGMMNKWMVSCVRWNLLFRLGKGPILIFLVNTYLMDGCSIHLPGLAHSQLPGCNPIESKLCGLALTFMRASWCFCGFLKIFGNWLLKSLNMNFGVWPEFKCKLASVLAVWPSNLEAHLPHL